MKEHIKAFADLIGIDKATQRRLRNALAGRPQRVEISPSTDVSHSLLDSGWEKALWGGFSGYAETQIELARNTYNNRQTRFRAGWALARLRNEQDRPAEALRELAYAEAMSSGMASSIEFLTYKLHLLSGAGYEAATLKTIDRIKRHYPESARAQAMISTALALWPERQEERLTLFNGILAKQGFAELALADDNKGLRIDNVLGLQIDTRDGPKISVLMPAYNCARTIQYAARSVLEQSWRNLELIIVDDASSDETWEIIEKIAHSDNRVIAMRNETNRGAYPSRNRALQAATGEYITVNDSDDWSHPQRIAAQMDWAIQNPGSINTTFGLRVSFNLAVAMKPRDGGIFVENTSSLLVEAKHIKELGGWDDARLGADSELYQRLLKHLNVKRKKLFKDTPLSFILSQDTSLTKLGNTSVKTVHYGARRQYREAYNYWQENSDDLRISNNTRAFPAPLSALSRDGYQSPFDLVLVSDFSMPGGTTSSNLAMLEAAQEACLTAAIFHLPRIDNLSSDLHPKIRRYVHDQKIDVIVSGEKIDARNIIINHPPVLMNLPDILPEISSEKTFILANQSPMTRSNGGRTVYDIDRVTRNAKILSQKNVRWAPISPLIRTLLLQNDPSIHLTDGDWFPLISKIASSPIAAKSSRSPVVGRHSRDHADKWLDRRADLRSAYLADSQYKIRILGGAKHAKKVLGEIPLNWEVLEFGSVDVEEFLSGLDFYVYFPQTDMIEAFGRAAMEAIAMGIPTILPDVFESTFGNGAIYTTPSDVQSTIERYWLSPELYKMQSDNALRFAKERCHSSLFAARLQGNK